MFLESYEQAKTLHDRAGDTLKKAPVLRLYDYNNPSERTYDFDKISSELIGKRVRAEIYSLTRDVANTLCGCYKEITGTVLEVYETNSIRFIIFDDGSVLDPYIGTEIKIEVLQ